MVNLPTVTRDPGWALTSSGAGDRGDDVDVCEGRNVGPSRAVPRAAKPRVRVRIFMGCQLCFRTVFDTIG